MCKCKKWSQWVMLFGNWKVLRSYFVPIHRWLIFLQLKNCNDVFCILSWQIFCFLVWCKVFVWIFCATRSLLVCCCLFSFLSAALLGEASAPARTYIDHDDRQITVSNPQVGIIEMLHRLQISLIHVSYGSYLNVFYRNYMWMARQTMTHAQVVIFKSQSI